MFDVGFSELMVIAVVALIVIGPERLPKVARTAGHLLGRLQRYVNDVKSEVNRELHLEEIRRLHQDMNDSAQQIESGVREGISNVEMQANAGLEELKSPLPQQEASRQKDQA